MMLVVLLRRCAQFVFGETVQSTRPRSDVAYANDREPAFWYLHGR